MNTAPPDQPDGLDEHDFLTITEAARLTRHSDDSVRRWVKQGRLAAYRIGTKLLLRRGDVLALIREVAT